MSQRLLLFLCLGLCAACGAKVIRETILERDDMRVELRRIIPRGSATPETYEHPVSIADVRMAHILASLTHVDSKGRKHPTIRSEHVYGLAEGIAKAVAKAAPEDEIGAASFPTERRLGIFKSERVTAFRAFFQEDILAIEFFTVEAPLDNNEDDQDYRIPFEAAPWKPGFKMVPGEGQETRGPRSVRVDWRSPQFARPINLRLRGGRVQRRTILMQAEEESQLEVPTRPSELDDEQTRALDQLEAARRSGIVSEAEFRRRRVLILEGRLEESGYAPETHE
jgi:hypothetical protein